MKISYRNIISQCIMLLALCACTDEYNTDTMHPDNTGGQPIALTLSYDMPQLKEVETRATDAEEKKLQTLEVFIFNKSTGNLKGYKKITEGLKQNGEKGEFTIKTTTGNSLIYGIANAKTTVYNVEDIAQEEWTEEKVANGEVSFNLTAFKEKVFTREAEINPTDGTFVMSGVMNDGNAVNLIAGTNGTGTVEAASVEKVIKLKRILSKVLFKFNASKDRKFTLLNYDICNIPTRGYIIEQTGAPADTEYTHMLGLTPSTQTPNEIHVDYLPENLQSTNKKQDASSQKDREKNSYDSNHKKSFDNAPENGTYVVVYGKYEETEGENNGRVANVEYTIHLGDFKSDFNNYDNERNCRYTYNVTVNGVTDIVVEAKKESETKHNPGVEGIVIDSKAGIVFTLDSHYESRVMRFYKRDIEALKKNSTGYSFLVETFGERSERYEVKEDWSDDKLPADLDYKWITFAKDKISLSQNNKEPNKADPIAYTYSRGKGVNETDDLYTAPKLLKYLYENANKTTEWSSYGNGNNKTYYMDFTCYIDENYYDNKSWNEYTNLPPRKFYIANEVYVSEDKESVYVNVAYAIEQRSIQTFFNPNKASELIAYGCETVNESPDITYKNATAESNVFDGRYTMAKYLSEQKYSDSWNNQWNSYKGSGNNNLMKDPMQTCMSRNRDLNRDGKLTLDELRWYVPSYAQYNGLWIGEEALSTESRLYQGQTSELGTNSNYNTNKWMHYYTSTQGRETFWSEEGSCYGTENNQTKHVKCIRNLQSNGTGVEDLNTALSSDVSVTPNKYYTYKPDNNTFDMSNVDEKCLRAVKQEQELGYHNEREPLNKVYNFFQVSILEMSGYYGHNNVLNGKVVCYGQYDEAGTTAWRIPNQREISLMSLEDDDLQLKFNNGVGCFARTAFSNQNYRSGYGFNNGALFLAQPNTTSQGTIRCVRDRNADDN